jgi:uncharacterized protein (TIGR03435 family)
VGQAGSLRRVANPPVLITERRFTTGAQLAKLPHKTVLIKYMHERMNRLAVALFPVLLGIDLGSAQITPTFASASIKPNKSQETTSSYNTSPGKLTIRNKSLKDCIRLAYGVKVAQLPGGPKWADQDRYDIEAAAKGPAAEPQLMVMLQTLLKDRFKLDFHRETKMFPGYAMTVLKTGLAIHEVEPGAGHINLRRGGIDGQRASMPALAQTLSDLLGTPVLDATAVPGVFDFRLSWTPTIDVPRPGLSGDDPDPSVLPENASQPSLFAAIQEQLGLKLEARKSPLDVLVIDHAAKPVVE